MDRRTSAVVPPGGAIGVRDRPRVRVHPRRAAYTSTSPSNAESPRPRRTSSGTPAPLRSTTVVGCAGQAPASTIACTTCLVAAANLLRVVHRLDLVGRDQRRRQQRRAVLLEQRRSVWCSGTRKPIVRWTDG